MAGIVYNASPTLRLFHQSDQPYRVVRGPVGCLSGDTEYLSPRGWRRIDSYTGGPVAQWRDGHLEWVLPDGYINASCSKMLEFSTKNALSMRVTPNHRVPVYNHAGKFVVKTAEQLYRRPSRYRVPINWTSSDGLGISEQEIRLRVMIAADGYYPKAGNQCVVCVRKERKKRRVRQILTDACIAWKESARVGRPTEMVFAFPRPAFAKPLGEEWFAASSAELAILIDEMSYWDGLHDHEEVRFSTTKPVEADVVQFAAHANGMRASISRITYPNIAWSTGYNVHVCRGHKAVVGLRNETNRQVVDESRQYCFEVPSSFFIARHAGKIFVTGNSGKSSAMVMEMLRRAAQQKPDPKDGKRRSRGVIVRNTLPQLKNTSLKTIMELIGPIIDWRPSENTVYVKQGDIEAEWILMPLDTPDNVQRLLSLDLTYAWLSELRELPPQIMLDVFGRCGRYPSMMHGGPSWYGVFGETNSFTEDSDWNTILELRELQGKPLPATWGYWVQPGARDANAENKQNLVPGYYENLIESNSPEWVEQYVDNIIAPSLSGEAVFRSSFRRSFHVATSELQPIPGRLVIVGMDFGRNPAAVLTQMDLKGRLLVLDSLCQSNMGLEQFVISHLRPLLSSQRYMGCAIGVVGDPSGVARSQIGEESVFGALRRLGFSAQPAQTNAIEPRLRAVEKILLQQRDGGAAMLFSPHCEQLLMAISSRYRYAKRRDGDLQPQPDKGHPWSDLADALQYATLGYSGSISGRFMRPRKDERSEPRLKSAGWT